MGECGRVLWGMEKVSVRSSVSTSILSWQWRNILYNMGNSEAV